MGIKTPKNLLILSIIVTAALIGTVLLANHTNILTASAGGTAQVKGCPAAGSKPCCEVRTCPAGCSGACCGEKGCMAEKAQICCGVKSCPAACANACCNKESCNMGSKPLP